MDIFQFRFQLILRYIHCNDNSTAIPRGEPGFDRLHKVRPVLDLINRTFPHSYRPGRDISVDESIVGHKGRDSLVQYMPNKKSHR